MSKTAKFGKNTQGMLGINAYEFEMDHFLCHWKEDEISNK
jgi:hypothetical protein